MASRALPLMFPYLDSGQVVNSGGQPAIGGQIIQTPAPPLRMSWVYQDGNRVMAPVLVKYGSVGRFHRFKAVPR